ncbi:MAG: crotonase/enoyl-CoA hydratase family protein [Rubrivivax sp.]|nr:crotonase/enoyl-CoA hydratase family protein [Rubrivivax sp.]MDH5338695.1 crotonase/enoyl-CoA hydratase family protein [Rubrivivax sp.]
MNPPADSLVTCAMHGHVCLLTLNRPAKRNAVSDALVDALGGAFTRLPADARAVVLAGAGDHFCAGLDLSELTDRDVFQGIQHSRNWHAALDRIQYAAVPVVAVLHGAVVGGGLEIASAAHVRVAEKSAFYAFPEGQRGIFVGGGGSVRVPRLIGTARVADMMLTGRVLDADEGQAAGLTTYLVEPGHGLAKGLALAEKIAANAPMTNYALIQALPRIAELAPEQGLFMESLVAAIAQAEPAAKERLRAFLDGKAGKVGRPS